MFCMKCGAVLPDGTNVCPVCGYKTEYGTAVLSESKSEPVFPQLNQQPIAAQSYAPVDKSEKFWKRTDVLSEEQYELKLPEQRINPDEEYEVCLDQEEKPIPVYHRPEKKIAPLPESDTPKKVGAVIAAVAVLAVVIAVIVTHTTAYKLHSAEKYIDSGEYSQAQTVLGDIDDERALALNDYITVELARAEFLSGTDFASIPKTAENMNAYNAFVTALEAYNDSGHKDGLPEEYGDRINAYNTGLELVNNVNAEKVNNYFVSVQQVFLNEVICNHNAEFTLAALQKNIDASKQGVDSLNGFVSGISDKYDESDVYLASFIRTVNDLTAVTNTELDSSAAYIEEIVSSNSGTRSEIMNRSFSRGEKDYSFESTVLPALNNVTRAQNIEDNARFLTNYYKISMLGYFSK